MNINVIGLDIAKRTFHLVGLDHTGKQVLKKKLSRTKLRAYFANLTPCKVSMEGCAGAHYWARELSQLAIKSGCYPLST
jgi:transposase